MRRMFGVAEAVFDIVYLVVATALGVLLVVQSTSFAQFLAGIMAFVLVAGDVFHLVPRVVVVCTGNERKFASALGLGKLISSITMSVFYLFLWQIGISLYNLHLDVWLSELLYLLAAVRIALCLMPQNRWVEGNPRLRWSVMRNIPFLLQGAMVFLLFFWCRDRIAATSLVWLAIALSFVFYVLVVLFAGKKPVMGIFMFPKTLCYLWIILMFLIV